MKNFFNFTKGEQRGIVVLFILIGVVLVLSFFINNRPSSAAKSEEVVAWERDVIEFEQHRQEIAFRYDSIRAVQKAEREARFSNYEKYQSYTFPDDKPRKSEPEYFFFDPNTTTVEEFVRLGFSQKQAEAIERYRNRGAVFKEKEEFAKVFVVSEDMFKQLEPWILISETDPIANVSQTQSEEKIAQFVIIELNSCDTSALKKLKGIGNILSQKIVNEREKLGGYYSIEQLLNINGIDNELFEQIAPHLTVDATNIKKMDLNKATFKQLLQHPYFEYHIVKNIFNYKDKNGNFQTVEQLKEVPLMYEDLFQKIRPYLIVKQ